MFPFVGGDTAVGNSRSQVFADPGDTVYIVTLYPGEGSGDPVTFSSADQTEFPNRRNSQNCQFYIEDDGSMAFHLDPNSVPGSVSFTAPEGKTFKEWSSTDRYIVLFETQTTITAQWEYIWDNLQDAIFDMDAVSVTLDSPEAEGYYDVTLTANDLIPGKYIYWMDDEIEKYYDDTVKIYDYADWCTICFYPDMLT